MKIVTILGARPQFIKAAAVSNTFTKFPDIQEVIVHTGQHFDHKMSEVFFEEMCIPKPKYNLNINGLTHGAMTGRMIEEIEQVLVKEAPDWLLVYGDTNSTLAGAIAAKKMQIRVAHIEAGLRSFNMAMPEEINRILTDRISDLLFCASNAGMVNLKAEGYLNNKCRFLNVGDVMYDAALYYSNIALLGNKTVLPEKYALCTIHRAENTDDESRLLSIFAGLELCSGPIKIIIPLHPRTKAKLIALNYDFANSNIVFIEPVSYLEMIHLIVNSVLVMTDSGGLQKEAYFFEKNCVTIRDETEWIELLDHGYNVLAGTNSDKIKQCFEKMRTAPKPGIREIYGQGDASVKIANELLSFK
jgi:UDP-GlcNAc3NAcA epimerase